MRRTNSTTVQSVRGVRVGFGIAPMMIPVRARDTHGDDARAGARARHADGGHQVGSRARIGDPRTRGRAHVGDEAVREERRGWTLRLADPHRGAHAPAGDSRPSSRLCLQIAF